MFLTRLTVGETLDRVIEDRSPVLNDGGRRCQMSELAGTPPIGSEDGQEAGTPPIKPEDVAEIMGAGFIGYKYVRGMTHMRKRRWDKAASAFRRCIIAYDIANEINISEVVSEIVPRSQIFYQLGLALEQLADLAKSTEALEQAIAAAPGLMSAREALARVAIERSDYNRAIHEYKEAYVFFEENRTDYSETEANRMRCNILTRLGSLLMNMDEQKEEAEAVLSQAISIYPENPRALAYYAIIAGSRGDEIELKKYLSIALEKYRPEVDNDLVNDLLQDASNAEYGETILEMLVFHRQITYTVFTRHKRAWQRGRDELRKGLGPIHISNGGMVVIRPGVSYSNQGPLGAQGDYAINNGPVQQFEQVAPELKVNLHELVADLEQLRKQLYSEATHPEQFHAVGEIESAKRAAEKSDQKALIRHLQASGQWALEVATKIGTSLAEAAIKAALNLHS
jgi:tetratricopeptide (TPR) repeat protein